MSVTQDKNCYFATLVAHLRWCGSWSKQVARCVARFIIKVPETVHRHTSSQIIREAGGEWHFVSYAISPLPCQSKSLPLRLGRWRALVKRAGTRILVLVTAGRAGKSSFMDYGDVPPTLLLSPSLPLRLGRWRALVKRAGARILVLVTAGRAGKRGRRRERSPLPPIVRAEPIEYRFAGGSSREPR